MRKAFSRFFKLNVPTIYVYLALTVIFCVLLLYIWTHTREPDTMIAGSVSTLFASFFGAFLAFRLSEEKEVSKENREKIAELRLSLFILIQQSNALLQVWRHIKTWQNRPGAEIFMQGIKPPDYGNLKQDLKAISFILKDDPQLLLDLSIEEERFTVAVACVERHAEFHYKQVQEAIENHRVLENNFTIAYICKLFGERTYNIAHLNTINLFEHVPETLKSQKAISVRLSKLAKGMFPNETFTIVDIDFEAEAIK